MDGRQRNRCCSRLSGSTVYARRLCVAILGAERWIDRNKLNTRKTYSREPTRFMWRFVGIPHIYFNVKDGCATRVVHPQPHQR